MVRIVGASAQTDPLPSWNDSAAKQAITDFVARVTAQGSADFVPPAERIATFDNDGTLWCEQPNYFQALFALDRIRVMAPQRPEWTDQEPFKAFLSDWQAHRAFAFVPAQAIVARYIDSFKEFPPRAKAASFTVSDAMDKVTVGMSKD